ncbi:MAG: lipoyl synthase [Desulfohalobiaceae bacterium]|nr:lipoyl synthase [Desulfohalobiaceae bacterium]
MKTRPKPSWLRKKLPSGPEFGEVSSLLAEQGLHTVCREARCPNQGECFSRRTATFMIMGSKCTRNCRFCAVDHGPITQPDPDEAKRVALVAKELGLDYVVVTSVTRDDLPDGGAGCFAAVIRELKAANKGVKVEVLVPDFQGDPAALAEVVRASPQVLNHNLETVPRLYETARPQADYGRSLELLARAKQLDGRMYTKSGLMLGLGETKAEIKRAMADLLESGCTVLTLGQYLQPGKDHLPVVRYLPPEEFDSLRKTALAMGFAHVVSGPFVRSSYKAESLFSQKAPDAG